MKSFRLDKLTIDPVAYAIQGTGIFGIRETGKSYTATFMAERLFDAGIPFITFDAIGVWRFMRVPGKGRGYPVVVAGGRSPDLPLTPATAPAIVEAAMRNGVSLIVDLFSLEMSKGDWRRIVRDCVRLLLHRNQEHGLRHVFIEEAPEFIPQKPTDWEVYAEIEKLARMGGNSGLGYTIIGQRTQEVSKAILELCENMFLHRQRGKNSLENMDKWLAIAGAAEQKEIIKSLPGLEKGECWGWLGGDEPTPPTRIRVPIKNSLHPDRRARAGSAAVGGKAVDAGSFITGLLEALPKIKEEAAANDPATLRAEIARLKKEAKNIPQNIPAPDPEAAGRAGREAYEKGFGDGIEQAQRAVARIRDVITSQLPALLEPIFGAAEAAKPALNQMAKALPIAMPPARAATPSRAQADRPAGSAGASLPPGEKAVLTAAAQYPGVTRDQLGVLTGYKRSSRDAYIARLVQKWFIVVDGQGITATPGGMEALGSDYQPLPTGEALQAHWLQRLPPGEGAVLNCLIAAYPDSVDRDVLSSATGYKRSSRDAYVARLKVRRLVTTDSSGVKASQTLF